MKGTHDWRRIVALIVLVCVVGGTAAGLSSGLISCSPTREEAGVRPLSAAEAQRLGDMRVRNYRDARVGFRATLGKPGTGLRLAGWVDWRRPLVYLAATTPVPSKDDGLLQAVPGIVAVRDGRVDGDPPAVPPADGWRLRPFTANSDNPAVIDSFLALMFVIANEQPDSADVLARSEARWLAKEKYGDQLVDVVMGPAMPARPTPSGTPSPPAKPFQKPSGKPASETSGKPSDKPASKASDRPSDKPSSKPSGKPASKAASKPAGPAGPASPTPSPGSLAAMGGEVKYWLDGDARLHRFEALLAKDLPVTVELRRTDQPELVAVDAFGGRASAPREVTGEEAATLATMRQRNRKAGGGEITMSVPSPAGQFQARGWLDWRTRMAYFGIHELTKPDKRVLMRATLRGVSIREKGSGRGLPPTPPPGGGWRSAPWAARARSVGTLDLDRLVTEALAAASDRRDNPKQLAKVARWLRADTVGGAPVTVYEVSGAQGKVVVRYWVDTSGGLRRLELRTLTGAFAQLDITPGRTPKLS
ncbi:hypothetical protein WEI85_15490 [Actinomycetes bacterium KLBMP 9797]